MPTTTRVLIRLGKQWSCVGTAEVEEDRDSGARMLRLDLAAMAPQVFVSMKDIAVAEGDLGDGDEPAAVDIAGHA